MVRLRTLVRLIGIGAVAAALATPVAAQEALHAPCAARVETRDELIAAFESAGWSVATEAERPSALDRLAQMIPQLRLLTATPQNPEELENLIESGRAHIGRYFPDAQILVRGDLALMVVWPTAQLPSLHCVFAGPDLDQVDGPLVTGDHYRDGETISFAMRTEEFSLPWGPRIRIDYLRQNLGYATDGPTPGAEMIYVIASRPDLTPSD